MLKYAFGILMLLVITNASSEAGDFSHSLSIALDSALSDGHDFLFSGSTAEYDVKAGYSLIYEGLTHLSDTADIGFGLEFMIPHELDISGTSAAFSFAPLYVTSVFHTYRYRDYVPFISIQIGYNIVYDGNDDYKGSNNLTGGMYYGAGAGIIFSQVTRVEIRWARYEGVYETGLGDADISNNELSLVLGYYF